ncbi:unnamed protein product [Spirodela intermedia]|uniref:Uncharacterized protein n=1 Tax=Spirodela intermedia TaxID=51605 RepID=A0A7I8LDH3_SPIIN|nr:unnamed protein product [Spirodela intermedia]
MGTKVIRAQDRPRSRPPVDSLRSPPSGKTGRNDNSTLHRRSSPRSNKLPCPSPPPPTKHFRNSDKNNRRDHVALARLERQTVEKSTVKKIVMENVVILKRGTVLKNPPSVEDCKPSSPAEKTPPIGGRAPGRSTDRQGSGSEIPQKHAPVVNRKPPLYAGSGFVTSPAPSSLPLPTSFFVEKEVASSVDLATKSIRFLLRLDLA